MRNIIIQEFVSLDGVMQAPGGPDEDTTSGFTYGGWTAPFYAQADAEGDALMMKWMQPSDLLLGRKTFDIFEAYWPEHADLWPGIMDITKYCASTTRTDSDWSNTKFVASIEEIKALKETNGGDICVIGSGNLTQTLFEHGLVDEIRLITFPVILGEGKRLFSDHSMPNAFKLADGIVTKNGVVFASYTKDGEIQTGTVAE